MRLQSLGLLLSVGVMVCPKAAFAQDSSERTVAEALFREARELMNEGKYAQACPKLAESQRLDPGGGTLLNLAVCHEKQGRTATAWTEFHDALATAKRDGRTDRQQLAEQHIAALDPVLAHVSVVVAPATVVDGLTVQLSGTALPRAAWQTAVPVDPGPVAVSASAPGYEPWSKHLEAKPGDNLRLEVPPLERSPTGKGSSSKAVEPVRNTGSDTRRTLAYVSGAVGVVGVGVGSYFGLHALSKRHESDAQCPNGSCTQQGVDLNDAALRSATYSNVGFAVGVIGLGLGAYFFFSSEHAGSEPSSAQRRSISVSASARADRAGVLVSGRW